jgi:hypothetical protein
MVAAADVEPVFDTGLKVTITKEMPNGEGTVTYVYRRAHSLTVFGT